jgi:hypothetical protein
MFYLLDLMVGQQQAKYNLILPNFPVGTAVYRKAEMKSNAWELLMHQPQAAAGCPLHLALEGSPTEAALTLLIMKTLYFQTIQV